ncbi:hypothetical protein MGYG_00164 [Nannizzia gypsea CBS 118893]|uniref:F-box domain-containing protein n=1 Tax=Arthroderma gypseum (strain ATCC MYA-4604 / CBS 118893) TaxID=535722 RepID=E5R392_ARTGP|nr:hypothetical protein MGYG_00164 [Nannizzia gypsea CBS 118893]EFQ97121.1 hypothetical protein MGYG_00164 [Nannizzia gypsea CBS 118893]
MLLLQQPVIFAHMRKRGSRLLKLPFELRLKIYLFYFMSVTIYLGGSRPPSLFTPPRYRLNHNSLAILSTCRQIFYEASNLFPENVLLSFDNPDNSVYHLTRLPAGLLSRIRHVELDLASFKPFLFDFQGSSIASKFNMISSLQLNTLSVYGTRLCYDLVESFVKFGQGWKELRILISSLKADEFKKVVTKAAPDSIQTQQPTIKWQTWMECRDGRGSGASVSLYCTTKPWKRNSALNPSTRELVSSSNLQNLMLTREIDELLFIVKRGEGATYTVRRHTAKEAMQEVISKRGGDGKLSLRQAIAYLGKFDPIIKAAKAQSTTYSSSWT